MISHQSPNSNLNINFFFELIRTFFTCLAIISSSHWKFWDLRAFRKVKKGSIFFQADFSSRQFSDSLISRKNYFWTLPEPSRQGIFFLALRRLCGESFAQLLLFSFHPFCGNILQAIFITIFFDYQKKLIPASILEIFEILILCTSSGSRLWLV